MNRRQILKSLPAVGVVPPIAKGDLPGSSKDKSKQAMSDSFNLQIESAPEETYYNKREELKIEVSNPTDKIRTETLVVTVFRDTLLKTEVTLKGGDSQTVELQWVVPNAAGHASELKVTAASASVEQFVAVKSRASVEFLNINPESPTEKDKVEITYRVELVGNAPVQHDVTVSIDGKKIDQETIDFSLYTGEGGTYTTRTQTVGPLDEGLHDFTVATESQDKTQKFDVDTPPQDS